MKITAIIADDEEIIRTELWRICNTIPELEVVGVCNSGDEALELISSLNPNLALLDISMPGKTGIEVAQILRQKKSSTAVAFITAYTDYALQAFSVGAIDYILKPIDEENVKQIINKYAAQTRHKLPEKNPVFYPKKIAVENSGEIEVLDTNTIQIVCAHQRLVFIHTIDGKKYLGRLTLQEYSNILDPHLFCRCHRNYIINIDQILRISKWFNGSCLLTLKGCLKQEIPVSRTGYQKLKSCIYFG